MLLVTSCCHKGSVQACCRLVQLRVLQTDPTHSATHPDVMPAAALAWPPTSTRPAHPLAHTHVFCVSHSLPPPLCIVPPRLLVLLLPPPFNPPCSKVWCCRPACLAAT